MCTKVVLVNIIADECKHGPVPSLPHKRITREVDKSIHEREHRLASAK